MATLKIIELNSAVKPYSRRHIASKLTEIRQHLEKLNKRQIKALNFYLQDFNKELKPNKDFKKRLDAFYYKDSLFTFSINPILGAQYWTNQNGTNYHTWNGAEVFAYVGKHVGVYASLRDNHDEIQLSNSQYLNTRPAARYKSGNDYSEMRGGINLSWKWGTIGLVKDHLEWGNYNHYPSILSSKAPSIAQIKLNLYPAKWFEFNYFHGWLNSGVIDSARTYQYTNSYGNKSRIVYTNKYIASNLFTFKPWPNFYTSVGNSIIYSDMNVHPAYLVPFMLFKSIDHTLNDGLSNDGGQNSQFFFDISSRQVKYLHLYASLLFDDISISRLKKNKHLDYYSLNAGFKIQDLIPNLAFTFEYFQSYPLVYKHDMLTTTYESNKYNLGHYMLDNSKNIYLAMQYRPIRGLSLKGYYSSGKHGLDHTGLGTDRLDVVNLFMDAIDWKSNTIGVFVNYQIINDLFLYISFEKRTVKGNQEKYTSPYYYGRTNTISCGLNVGF